jgi:undecaprenyl-diphosphatase
MDVLHALALGIFQGITEFLPISSSGHLVLAEHFFGLPAEELIAFDAVLHGGSLAALIAVFHTELKRFYDVICAPKKAKKNDKKLLFWLILATIPTLVFGYLGNDSLEIFRTPNGVAGGFLFCALLFLAAERFPKKKSEITTRRSAFLSALFQVIALLPGVSRSGIVTAAGMLSGTSRKESTRFAFLLGIPVIAAAFSYALLQILLGEVLFSLDALSIGIGFLSSAVSGFFMAKFLLRFFAKHTLYPFAAYLILLSILVFVWGKLKSIH